MTDATITRRGGLDALIHDVRFAARTLRRRPATAALAVAILALGIGASATIHDAGRALATDAVPFPAPDRLAAVELRDERWSWLSPRYADVVAWESEAGRLFTLGAYTPDDVFLGDGAGTVRVPGARVSGGFFAALDVAPLLGRVLSPADAAPGAEPAAVITQRLWESRFGADPGIVGEPVRIDGRVHTIIGVVPAGMQYPVSVDVWTPLAPAVGADAGSLPVSVVARLRDGVSRDEARAALLAVQRRLDAEHPTAERTARVDVLPITGRPEGSDRLALILLQGAVLVLLLITSVNAGGLLLTRAIERRQELAVRSSLGATRGRIARQLLAESALIAAAAAALGLFLADLALAVLRNGAPASVARNIMGWEQLGLDAYGALFALALAAVVGIALGIVPALRVIRGDLTAHLREGAPSTTTGRRGSRVARLLLAGEVALALTLLVTAGLLTRSLLGLLDADTGFRADGVLAVEWALPPERYEGREAVARFHESLLERLGGLPGVRSAALASSLPMGRAGFLTRRYYVEGLDPAADVPSASWRPVTPSYFSTLGISLLRGRGIEAADAAGARRVAVISEALARRHWADGAEPLGRTLEVDGESWTVVGVVADVRDFGAQRRASPTIYVPQAQSPTRAGFLALRVEGDPAALAPRVREEIWALDPDVAIGEVRTMPRMVEDYYADERIFALLMGAFAAVALLITLASLYALVAHSVARRRREIGIRLTLGARPGQILADAMGQAGGWVLAGIVLGLGMAAGVAQLLGAMLYGVGPLDPAVFLLVPLGMLAVALVASWVPARRASTVDPVEVLRGG